MRILVIQHDDDKGLGLFEESLLAASLELDVRLAGKHSLALDGHAGVIALPGIANPVDPTAAIDATRATLAAALGAGLPVLGICLGAELLAEAAGAATRPCPAEWGYHEVALEPAAADDPLLGDLPEELVVFQAHAYAFELPAGAVSLARTPGMTQAFRSGEQAWGIQFHPEPTVAMIDGWTYALGDAMLACGVDPAETRELARGYVPVWREHAAAMARRFAAVL
jgi:GMP synthase (glutamine-hydrolysing)